MDLIGGLAKEVRKGGTEGREGVWKGDRWRESWQEGILIGVVNYGEEEDSEKGDMKGFPKRGSFRRLCRRNEEKNMEWS